MKGIFLFMTIAFHTLTGFAQKENTHWFFGYGAGLNFTASPPVFEPNGQTFSWEGCASVSDDEGKLLFYSDGMRIWDADHSIMLNGDNLLGDTIATQSVQIVPFPGNEYLYYVFTVNAVETKSGDLRYSIVDMGLNNGKGGVTTDKNLLLNTASCEKITAIRHANANDVWLITHLFESNTFNVYRINCKGIDPVPQQYNVGNFITGRVGNAIGYIKTSPDGRKLAMASFLSVVEVFDFDNNTGIISNGKNIGTNPGICAPYGIEFSPDSKLLYVTEIYDCGATGNYKIIQYNLEATNITGSLFILESAYGPPPGALQLGPDNMIYIAFSNASFLGAIAQPDVSGSGCTYVKEYLVLPGPAKSGIGLPAFVSGINRTILGNNISVCEGTDTLLHVNLPNTTLLWQNGSSENSFQPEHSGNYSISVTHNGCTYFDSIDIEFREKPEPDLGPDLGVCNNMLPLVLEQTISAAAYQWQDGSDKSSYAIDKAGLYWVEATVSGCSARDSVMVAINAVPSIELGKDTTFCEGTELQLHADAALAYQWSTGATSQSILTSEPGKFWCRVINQFGCFSSDTINTSIRPGPEFSLGSDSIICSNSLIIDLTTAGDKFLWNDHTTSGRFIVRTSGTYHVQVTRNDCIQRDTVLYVFKTVPAPSLGNDAQLCPGEELVLDPGSLTGTIVWSDGTTGRLKKINSPGTYSITASNECGSTTDEIIVKPGGCTLSIPNAFTPRRNQNNIFRIARAYVLKGFQLKVYNRWGQLLFVTNESSKGWDGTYNGSLQPTGTYAYIINYQDSLTGELVIRKGTVLLIQ